MLLKIKVFIRYCFKKRKNNENNELRYDTGARRHVYVPAVREVLILTTNTF